MPMARPGSVLRAVNYANLDAEKILQGFGKFGAYQMFVYAMANIGLFLFVCETMIISLISESPDFECIDDAFVNSTTALNVCEYTSPLTKTTTQCSKFRYPNGKQQFLTSDFDLVCEKASYAEHSTMVFMVGSMMVTPLITWLADLYGRRKTYLASIWVTVAANIGCTFAPTYVTFLIFRFFAGVGTAGVGSIGFVIILETVAPSFRAHTSYVSTFVWVFGYTMTGVVHMLADGWRRQFFILIVPFVLTVSYYWLLPESLHWLVTKKKHQQVHSYIEKSSKFNKKHLDLETCRSNSSNDVKTNANAETANHLGSHAAINVEKVKQRHIIDIFRSGPILFQVFTHCYINIVMNFTYWALSLYSVDLHENKMVGYFLSGFVELPAGLAIFLLYYFGRRTVTSMALMSQAIAMFVACFFPGKNVTGMSLFLLAKVFNSVAWIAEPLLVGEMSPTSMRNMIYGVIGFVGETGSAVAPYFNQLKVIDERAPAIVVATLSLVASVFALCSPETKDVAMPEDIDDFNPGPVYRFLFGGKANASSPAKFSKKAKEDTANEATVTLLSKDSDKKDPKTEV
uniref:MFS domain-containing protein n=1 Tax=Panagrellus redivivus TaxID=6233 RepID=A0A7E4ZXI3_PANRE